MEVLIHNFYNLALFLLHFFSSSASIWSSMIKQGLFSEHSFMRPKWIELTLSRVGKTLFTLIFTMEIFGLQIFPISNN